MKEFIKFSKRKIEIDAVSTALSHLRGKIRSSLMIRDQVFTNSEASLSIPEH